jgi:hypothetical protein
MELVLYTGGSWVGYAVASSNVLVVGGACRPSTSNVLVACARKLTPVGQGLAVILLVVVLHAGA